MAGTVTVLTDTNEWKEESEAIFRSLQMECRTVSSNRYPDDIPEDTRILVAILPRPDHPVVLRINAFKKRYPTIPVLGFFPRSELNTDQWMLLKRLDGVAALPLDSVTVRDLLKLTGKHQDLEQSRVDLQSRIDQMDTIYQTFVSAGRAMASSLEVDHVLTRIMRAAGELLQSEAWSVALIDPDSGDLVFRTAQGNAAQKIIGIRVPRGQGIIGWVCESGEPLIVPDTSKDQRHFKGIDDRSGFKSKSILCMPLKTNEKNLGAIEFINKVGSQFSREDMERVQILLDMAAVCLDNAMMFERLAAITERDELTGLFNQQALMQKLESLIQRCKESGETFGYIFLDLDYLKQVNDKHGHLRGRTVIREVGNLLRKKLAASAIIGRYGGDEFWVILPGADKVKSVTVAENIRKAIERHVFLADQDLNIRLTASIGVVVFPQHARTFDSLAQLADEALFMAKKQNRNRVICALDTLPPEGLCLS